MAVFVPGTGVAPADLFEDLSRDLVEQYRAAEARILAKVQRQIDRQLEDPTALPDPRLLEQLAQTRAALANVEAATRRLEIDPNLADDAVRTAVAEGTAAAADRLGLVDVFPPAGPLTSTAASATVQVALDLRSRLDDVKLRILRFEEDAYQRIIAQSLPPVLLGTTYSIDQQRATVARWLSDGIPAFVDKSGRRWSTGAYVEMATRTGLSRAYTEASIARQQQVGVDLVSIVVGASACRSCAQWIGKILSTSGQTGTLVLPHATTGAPTEVHIADTLGHARSTSHLNGPNCRCIAVAYLPGLAIPVGATAYDPAKEAARDKQRELERRLRSLKTRLALSPSEDEQAALRARIRATQGTLRAHIAEHDLPRKAYREQPSWAHGKPLAVPPPEPVVPEPPTPPAAPAQPLAAGWTSSTTGREAQDAFRARHGISTTGFDGVDDESARHVLGALSGLLDDYPARIDRISVADLPPGVLAEVTPRPVTGVARAYLAPPIDVSRDLLNRPAALRRALDVSVEHGHFHRTDPDNPWRQSVVHEFAHVLDLNTDEALRTAYRTELAAAQDEVAAAAKFKPAPPNATRAEQFDADLREQRAQARAVRAWRKANLSGYGQKNAAEGVAEAWADWRLFGDEALPFSRRIGPILDEILRNEL